jgi:hypothetical protein
VSPAASFIAPGATLGVLGGGQLGRMFAHAAQRAGYRVAVLDPDETSPAGTIAHEQVRTAYLDPAGLARLAEVSAALTTEFENVPAEALATLAKRRPVAPGADAVAICQDRVAEKAAFARAGVACAPFAVLASTADLDRVADALLPGILKTARLGYDGKGQRRVASRAELARAFAELGGVTCVLERRGAGGAAVRVFGARAAPGESRARAGPETDQRHPRPGLARGGYEAVAATDAGRTRAGRRRRHGHGGCACGGLGDRAELQVAGRRHLVRRDDRGGRRGVRRNLCMGRGRDGDGDGRAGHGQRETKLHFSTP